MILDNGKYKVLWESFGWTYAIPVVYIRRRLFGIEFWSRYQKGNEDFVKYTIRETTLRGYDEKQLEEWFRKAIAEMGRIQTVIDAHKV